MTTMQPTESVLNEAVPESLSDLFDKDPLSLTDSNIARIVAELRLQRSRWATSEEAKKAAPRPSKAAPKIKAQANLSIDDLFGSL